jgi:Protein of unknown function (DUF1097)
MSKAAIVIGASRGISRTIARRTGIHGQKSEALWQFVGTTVVAAILATVATSASIAFNVPVWAMFIGWVAYYSRGHSAREGLANFLCLLLGLGFGILAGVAIAVLTPALGAAAVAVVVFVIGLIVVSLRAVPFVNNTLSYFLGLISFFAVHAAPSVSVVLELAGACAIGSLAAWGASMLQSRLMQGRPGRAALSEGASM